MPMPVLARDQDGVGGVEADDVLDLLLDALRLGGGQVDLVEDRHDLVVGVERLVDVGERLRLDALRGVDHQQRALAGGEASARPRRRSRRGRACPSGSGCSPCRPWPCSSRRTVCALMVMPRSRSMSIVSRYCARSSRASATAARASGCMPVGEGRLAVVDVGDDGEVCGCSSRVMRGV